MEVKKILYVAIISAVVVAGCDQKEMQKKQLMGLKSKVAKMNEKIKTLEEQLADTTNETALRVTVKEMKPETFNHYIMVYGEVEADDYARISPEMGGQIKQIHVIEGESVSKGQLLITLNTEAVASQINSVKTNLDLATTTFEKQKALWEQNIGSEIQYLNAKSLKESLESQLKGLEAQMRMSQIRAPFNGFVDKINAKEGELGAPGYPIIVVVNTSKLSVTANVSEVYTAAIKKGQEVEVSFSSIPGLVINTPIIWVSNVLNKQNRSFDIKVEFNNQKGQIKPFMVSTLTIEDFSTDKAFVIPSNIIKQDIKGKYIYKIEENNGKTIASKIYIKTGLSYQDMTMVTGGVKQGDKVIIDGYSLVNNGLPVAYN